MKVVFHEDFYQVYASDPAAAPGCLESVVEAVQPYVDFITVEPTPRTERVGSDSGPDQRMIRWHVTT